MFQSSLKGRMFGSFLDDGHVGIRRMSFDEAAAELASTSVAGERASQVVGGVDTRTQWQSAGGNNAAPRRNPLARLWLRFGTGNAAVRG